MSCSQPFFILNKSYRKMLGYGLDYSHYGYYVPCGWCLNCRKDKQNFYCDKAKYEFKTRLVGSFVTFTYDDSHLLTNCIPKGSDCVDFVDNIPVATLNYDDFTNYIQNVRKYIQNNPSIQNVLCQSNFSYMYVGEYGDEFSRPHFHCLFFGLDFAYCKKLLSDKWKYGLIDVLPILEGGIEYVTKYMDKQINGLLAVDSYDSKGLLRPRLRCSNSFGKGLLLDNVDDIKSHNYSYKISPTKRRPISQYWKKLLEKDNIIYDDTDYKLIKKSQIQKMKTYNLKDFSRKSRDEFFSSLSKIRESKLYTMLLNNGIPALDVKNYFYRIYGHIKPLKNVRTLTNQALSDWSEIYRKSITVGGY